jgi:hypothetical protein
MPQISDLPQKFILCSYFVTFKEKIATCRSERTCAASVMKTKLHFHEYLPALQWFAFIKSNGACTVLSFYYKFSWRGWHMNAPYMVYLYSGYTSLILGSPHGLYCLRITTSWLSSVCPDDDFVTYFNEHNLVSCTRSYRNSFPLSKQISCPIYIE